MAYYAGKDVEKQEAMLCGSSFSNEEVSLKSLEDTASIEQLSGAGRGT